MVNSIGSIATVIGGVIAVASLTGLALPSIAGVISDWAGAVGLLDIFVQEAFHTNCIEQRI